MTVDNDLGRAAINVSGTTNSVTNCEVDGGSNRRGGIYLEGSGHMVQRNKIVNGTIEVAGSAHQLIQNKISAYPTFGIFAVGSGHLFQGNEIRDSPDQFSWGLHLTEDAADQAANEIKDNIVENATVAGIWADAPRLFVSNNLVTGGVGTGYDFRDSAGRGGADPRYTITNNHGDNIFAQFSGDGMLLTATGNEVTNISLGILRDGLTHRGVTVTGNNVGLTGGNGGVFVGAPAGTVTVSANTAGGGIDVSVGPGPSRTTVSGNVAQSLDVTANAALAMTNEVSGNDIRGTGTAFPRAGLTVTGSRFRVTDNKVSSATAAGLVVFGNNNEVTDLNKVTFSHGAGLSISGDDNRVTKNIITDNGGAGVEVGGMNNQIGADRTGTDTALGNEITRNGQVLLAAGHGVSVTFGTGNTIRLNKIYKNEGRGIDLGGDSWDINDPADADTGANGRQNYPTLLNLADDGSQTFWMLNAAPGKTYTIDVYTDPNNNFSEYAEGEVYLETISSAFSQTDASGHLEFSTPLGGDRVTMTVTDPDGNTSEFSLLDTDADGLADAWEEAGGIDVDEDGALDVALPGARRTHKNLYLELDAMQGREPVRIRVIEPIIQAFAHAPASAVRNPDGTAGIDLYVTPLQVIPRRGYLFGWGDYHADKQQYFANGQPGSPGWVAASLAYRYMIFADTQFTGLSRQYWNSGESEAWGNDGMVTLGSEGFGVVLDGLQVRTVAGWMRDGLPPSDEVMAGTLMHEFGHTLGLQHGGGGTAWNNSGNDVQLPIDQYVSVMSYAWQTPTPDNTTLRQQPPVWGLRYADADWANIRYVFRERAASASGAADAEPPDPDEAGFNPALIPGLSAADLETLGTVTRAADGTITLSIQVANLSLIYPATGATATIRLPADATVVSVSPSQGAAAVQGGEVVVQLGAIAADGFATIIVVVRPAGTGTFTASAQAGLAESDGNAADNTRTLTAQGTGASGDGVLAVGGANGSVAVFAPTGGQYGTTPAATLAPFAGFTGQVRTATADVNGDGVPDIVAVTGPGTAIRVAVISGADNSTVLVNPFDPFGGDFTGGGFVAAADIDGDGRAEFVVTPDEGGGPRVSIFSLSGGAQTLRANFFGIDDPNFRGGARSALGDVNGDGKFDLAVSAGFLGGPRTALFDGATLLGTPTRLISDFFAFPGSDAETLRNGVFVAAGDLDGDGFAELVFGGGPGGAPRVFILGGAKLAAGDVAGAQAAPVGNFFVAGNSNDRGGVRLAVKDADGDAKADVIAGSGEGSPSKVRVYLGKNFSGAGEPSIFQDLDPFGATLPGGVFVG